MPAEVLVDGLEDRSLFRTLRIGDVTSALLDELERLARSTWCKPWDAAIVHALRTSVLIATPVADHLPTRRSAGRVGLVGDAAQAVPP